MAKRLGPSDPFKLIIDRSELNRLLSSPDSEIALDLAKKAQRVAASAKRRAPKETGELKSSIGWTIGRDSEGLYAEIGTNVLHGKFQESGHIAANGRRVAPRRYLRPALRALGRGRPRR